MKVAYFQIMAPNFQNLLLVAMLLLPIKASYTECSWDIQCEELYLPGSKCMENGMCSNPFAEGCLHNFYSQYGKWEGSTAPKRRVCNSDDGEDSSDCDRSHFNYTEVRVHNADWESAIFYSWILQIFLSEFLNVPVTVGLSDDTKVTSFYNVDNAMSWSSQSYAFEALIMANEMDGRCDLTDKPCAHVLPEVWIGQEKKWKQFLSENHIDQISWDGQVGKISWYIPATTAERYPSMTSYRGMAGRREELAEMFLRPTTWGDYCAEESFDGCMEPDDVAKGPPGVGEEDLYFLDGMFTGYFRATDENNCTANPDSCTGHIVGAPCTWDTYLDAQTYHNDIALESSGPLENNGYTYGQMVDIWRAANATESNVVMWWWTPEATAEEFRGTPYEFQQVLLPEPTLECREARIKPADRCSVDQDVRRGNVGGGCDDEASPLQTVIASSLQDLSYGIPEVERSPGYQAIRNLKVSHLDMNILLRKWVAGGRTGYAAREAVCTFVVEHQEEVQSYIPPGFPRVFVDTNSYNDPLLFGAMGVAGFAFLYTLISLVLVYAYSHTRVFVYAQVPFIAMLLLGLLLVSCGSFLLTLEPQDGVCISHYWLVTLGYTMELVPLLVKVAAINRLMAATKRMRRIQISMQSLFVTVAGFVILVVFFLTCWTILDPPRRSDGRYLRDEAEIVTTLTCSSGDGIWALIVLCWNALLIIGATVLAYQSRTVKEEFNESQSLGTMIYSHFVLTVLYGVVSSLQSTEENDYPTVQPSTLAAAGSFLLSFDVITAVTIYVIPKIHQARKPAPANGRSSFITSSSLVNSSEKPNGGPQLQYSLNSQRSSVDGSLFSTKSHEGSSSRRTRATGALSRNSMPSINEESNEASSRELDTSPKEPKRNEVKEAPFNGGQDIGSDSTDEEDNGGPRFARVTATGSISSRGSGHSVRSSHDGQYPHVRSRESPEVSEKNQAIRLAMDASNAVENAAGTVGSDTQTDSSMD